MIDLLKVFAFFGSMVAIAFLAVCMVASLMVGQWHGCFWYGMGVMVFGAAFKAMLDGWFDF